MGALKERLQADMKAAMKSGAKERLGTIRLALAAIRQREIDERVELDDEAATAVLDRMVKQRRESISQYRQGGREDLVAVEEAEIVVLREYLPQPLDESVLEASILAAIEETGASTVADMGKVMAVLKPKLVGRADMSAVSSRVRVLLSAR
ncbi:MAG: GatB/YqeY domain-containing protein [Methylotetracoccus sp.]